MSEVLPLEPKPKAIVRREVGGFKMLVPVDLTGRGHYEYFEIGVNLSSAPEDVFENNPIAAFKLRQAFENLLTNDVVVKYGKGARTAETVKLHDLLTDIVVEKVRETL